MIVTKKQIKDLDPCTDAWKWYLKEKHDKKTTDLLALLLITNAENASWARWLFTRLMTVRERREIAIFAAEQVLPIFEKKYPKEFRPRKAIEAAKAVLKNDTPKNRKAAYAAADAAYAAYAAAYANAAYAAAYAAYAAAYAAYAAVYAADAAAYAADAARNKMQKTIIRKAVSILEARKE
jgi:hypothetical protein